MTGTDLVFKGRWDRNTRTNTSQLAGTRTHTVSDTLHANILKSIALVCVDGWVWTDWNLAAIIGEAPPPSLGTWRKGGTTNCEGGWSERPGKFGHVLRFCKYFSVVSLDTAGRRHFHGTVLGLRRMSQSPPAGFPASVSSVLQMDAFSSRLLIRTRCSQRDYSFSLDTR